METLLHYNLPKEERLHGKKNIETLLARGRWGDCGDGIRYCFIKNPEGGLNRIMVSVPKKNFKRAVRRNLLKRRIRESYRLQKHSLECTGIDILFVYGNTEILEFRQIYDAVGRIINKINGHGSRQA